LISLDVFAVVNSKEGIIVKEEHSAQVNQWIKPCPPTEADQCFHIDLLLGALCEEHFCSSETHIH
jgi:hypothetical protein